MNSYLKIGLLLASVMVVSCESTLETSLASLRTETIRIDSISDIVMIDDTLVRPILYQNIPSFKGLPVDVSKRSFIAVVLPGALIARYKLAQKRQRILALSQKKIWVTEDSVFYSSQSDRFKATGVKDLLARMRTHPNSILLAQAAEESGWGSSRFFRQANNLFGIWSYNEDEPRVQARVARQGKKAVYLRKYDDLSESIMNYYETVGRTRAYKNFRKARTQTQEVTDLLPHLKYYSERREAYVEQLKTIIRQNDLTQYDHHQIDPKYFVAE